METRFINYINLTPFKMDAQFEDVVAHLRAGILKLEQSTLNLLTGSLPDGELVDQGEVVANVKLAYRHLEDARMRLGKVFQAMNGGVSNNIR